MPAYYNEIDSFAAAWLRELIARNLIAPGVVDERSIADVQPDDLSGFAQCHFFAGIGVWSYALRLAGWPDDRPVWTGSCPCQPFSDAGKGAGFDDPRHLWPAWFRLIRERRPDVCFGEQVASNAGLAWLDAVSADVESAGYAIGSADLCAAGVGAPHRRQRLLWVAESEGQRYERRAGTHSPARGGAELTGWVGNAERPGLEGFTRDGDDGNEPGRLDTDAPRSTAAASATRRLADTNGRQPGDGELQRRGEYGQRPAHRGTGFWADAEWIDCTDGKTRPVEPGTFPLVTGAAARLVRLRGYGNAIVAPQAQAFIEAYLDVRAHD